MKNTMKVLCAGAVAALLASCATDTNVTAGPGPKERALTQAGFVMKMTNTPSQQQRLAGLPVDRISMVRFHARTAYVYRSTTPNEFYIGSKLAYLRFKNMIRDDRAAMRATTPNQDVARVEITENPNPVIIREYDGWGPLFPRSE